MSTPEVELMGPAQVAELLHVNPGTVSRWGSAGLLLAWRTLGGRRRYFGSEVRALARGESREAARALAAADRALLAEQPVPR